MTMPYEFFCEGLIGPLRGDTGFELANVRRAKERNEFEFVEDVLKVWLFSYLLGRELTAFYSPTHEYPYHRERLQRSFQAIPTGTSSSSTYTVSITPSGS